MTVDETGVVTGGGSMSEGEVNMVQDTYLPIQIRLYGEGKYHKKTYNTTDTLTWTQ